MATRRCGEAVLVLAAAVLVATPLAAHADDAEDFNRLQVRFNEQMDGARYREAQETSRLLRQYADGSLSHEPLAMRVAVTTQARVLHVQGKFAEAEPLYKWLLETTEQSLGPQHLETAGRKEGLAQLYNDQGRFVEAVPLAEQALAVRERLLGQEHTDVAQNLNCLAVAYLGRSRYADAERLWRRALAMRQKLNGPEHPLTAVAIDNLATAYESQARYAEAEPLKREALAIRRKVLPAEHPDLATSLNGLGVICYRLGRYSEGEKLYREALEIRTKALGPDHAETAIVVNNLATLNDAQGRHADAQPLLERALATWEKALGADSSHVAFALNNLALNQQLQGRWTEAEPLLRRALAIRQKVSGPDHADTGLVCNNLGELCYHFGRYDESEPLFRRALAIWKKSLSPDHPLVATTLANLASLCDIQGRFAESETLCKRALGIREKALGPEHDAVAMSLGNLGLLYRETARYAEAEPLIKRAQRIWEKTLGPGNPQVARAVANRSTLAQVQGRAKEAIALGQEALGIAEKAFGSTHPDVAEFLVNLALIHVSQADLSQAEPLVDRAMAIAERTSIRPDLRYTSYVIRAYAHWKAGRRSEALAATRLAMDEAEQQRLHASGAEVERAVVFSGFGDAFEAMVGWQAQLGGVDEALAAIERSRARSMLDEMALNRADLEIGRSPQDRQRLRRQEEELQGRIGGLQARIERLQGDPHRTAEDKAARFRDLQLELEQVRGRLYEHYREARTTSPVYRQLLSAGGSAPDLAQLRKRLVSEGDLLLAYLLGDVGGYVVAVSHQRGEIAALKVGDAAAKTLGIDAGPLTAARLERALANAQGTGVIQQLRDPRKSGQATDRLAALWQVLVPDPQRKALTEGKVKRLIVVPDGPLALLPLETLVVEAGKKPRYLVDLDAVVLYAPSATVLDNLVRLPAKAAASDREPVLTVGNPNYETGPSPEQARSTAPMLAQSRYGALGGKLAALPYSGWESQWVAEAFGGEGVKSLRLDGADATEANLKARIEGRRIVHLACHGLVDQAYGNLFGALALTAGPNRADPADDGFLTLAEIYRLNLAGTELAILSACDTNYGPQQRGEGVWTLSRGFLVAGSRRVVASSWLVDDEAAATMISYFSSTLAPAEKSQKPNDYAAALQTAKRLVRQKEKWKDPFYWGSFVLVGPN